MRVLRLADQMIPAMDKLMFYIRQTDRMLRKYFLEVKTVAATMFSDPIRRVLADTSDAATLGANDTDTDEIEDYEDEE